MADLKNVDALIAAAWRSQEQRAAGSLEEQRKPRKSDADEAKAEATPRGVEHAPPNAPVSAARHEPDDPISSLVTSAVAAALGDLNLGELDIEARPPARPDGAESIEIEAPAAPGGTLRHAEYPQPPAAAKTSKSDLVEGVISRVTAAMQFADANPRQPYGRVATTELLEEVTKALRQLREKRDDNQKQMERWFLQWRSSEAHALELSSEVTRIKGLLEQQTALLVMARAFAVQGDVRVEWRDRNSWVIVLNDHVLNKDKKWEVEDRDSEDTDYIERTRYTLSEAISRATALKIISND